MENQDNMALGYAMGRDANNGYGNGMFGGDWAAMWFLLAILGFGNGGWGGFGNNGGGNMLGYELGRAATQADVASGFNNSAVLSSLNDIKLGQAGVQQTLCQGFNGINQQIADCCCRTQRGIDSVNFNMERNTCDIIQNQNAGFQRVIDWLNCKETQQLRDELFTYKLQASQSAQNAYLIDQIRPTARPAYPACNPYGSSWGWSGFNGWGNNGGCCNNGY